ncbi:MAG: hypothetical protein PUE16_08475 [Lactimicrobium massiliense]|nr:hypothetical protein [Lactimicrobium massiliense]MDD6727350.1 hypothetical protein [Lactimicrobium massiliense]
MKSREEFEKIILFKKQEFSINGWNALEINAKDLMSSIGAGDEDLMAAVEAMQECMLEGDCFINDPGSDHRLSPELTVRYYCDNLSPDRRKYSE